MITEELKQRVTDFVEMERRSCSMDLITPEYVARSFKSVAKMPRRLLRLC